MFRHVYLSLGSNLGDRAAYLREAVARIALLPETTVVAQSTHHETAPWGNTEQPSFLNMALSIDTALSPEDLLDAIHTIEHALGRQRQQQWGPRTLDIDLLVDEAYTRDTPELHLPHPLMTARLFVLDPLAEIAPDLVVRGKTVREWRDALGNGATA